MREKKFRILQLGILLRHQTVKYNLPPQKQNRIKKCLQTKQKHKRMSQSAAAFDRNIHKVSFIFVSNIKNNDKNAVLILHALDINSLVYQNSNYFLQSKYIFCFIKLMLFDQSNESMMERQNLNKYRVDKNRLLLISVINVATFFCAIFSMAYHRWIHISFVINTKDIGQVPRSIQLWTNLLYASYEDDFYLTYEQVQEKVCEMSDTFCLAIFYQLDFVGKLCFGIFGFAFLLSSYDFACILKYALSEITTKGKFFVESASAINFKNNFRSALMVITYVIGVSLNYFAINLISLDGYSYGISFWLFIISLLIFVIASVWQNRKMSKIQRQQLVIRLLQKEKEVLRASNATSESVNHSDAFSI